MQGVSLKTHDETVRKFGVNVYKSYKNAFFFSFSSKGSLQWNLETKDFFYEKQLFSKKK